MKVAHVISQFAEGFGYEENYLGFTQASLGADVSIVTSTRTLFHRMWKGYNIASHDVDPGVYHNNGVDIHRLKIGWQYRDGTQIILRGLKDTLSRISPDIIHLHIPVSLLTAQTLGIAKRLDIPVVLDNHICYHNLEPYGAKKQIYYQVLGSILHRRHSRTIRRYLPLTRDCQHILHYEMGIPYSKMSHTTLGVDTSEFDFMHLAREQIRDEMGIPSDAPVVAFVGRIVPGKEIHVLTRAWERIALKHGVYLLFIGPVAGNMDNASISPNDKTLRDMVKSTGHVEHCRMPEYLSACDIGVWPAQPGVSAVEALACHIPIVYSDFGAVGHLAMYGNGRYFRRGDVDGLTETLDSMISDVHALDHMRRMSRHLAEVIFDWRVISKRTNEIYDAVLHDKTPSVPDIW